MIYSTGKKNQYLNIIMQGKFLRFFIVAICLSIYISSFSQETKEKSAAVKEIIDSLKMNGVIFNYDVKKPEITLSREQAIRFLQQKVQPQYWNDTKDPFRIALNQLIFEASHPRYDSAAYLLSRYPYDSLNIPWDKFYIWEPLRLKIPVVSPSSFPLKIDSLVKSDTSHVMDVSDSLLIPKVPLATITRTSGLKDTTIMVVIDTLNEVTSSVSDFPFRYFEFPYQGDSIQTAVNLLMNYLEKRDSSVIRFTGINNATIPVWLNSKTDRMTRFWLKNELSDSVTIWVGNPSRNTIGLYLEHGVNFRRPVKQGNYSDAKINVHALDNSKLLTSQRIAVKPQFWKYRTETSFVFSQSALSNWVKGGENSVSTALDVTGYADYVNRELKLSSNNFARLKLGFLKSGDNDIRKNLDLVETNSKLNHKAFGKFDFSAILLFKTQVAPGFTYSKDKNGVEKKTPASKLMNPAILTIGFGLDYKPNKTTSINFSPLSYKGTFVTDPAYFNQTFDSTRIDQTKYGIAKDKKSLNEPGASFMISNVFKPANNISVTNRLQLFTNYINNPLNIDVDWEMIAVINLNWFTDIRFNTHLIFDDDTKTVEKVDGVIKMLPDGITQKKTARIQFKEMLGLSLVFRF
jgi:hypothetical protein